MRQKFIRCSHIYGFRPHSDAATIRHNMRTRALPPPPSLPPITYPSSHTLSFLPNHAHTLTPSHGQVRMYAHTHPYIHASATECGRLSTFPRTVPVIVPIQPRPRSVCSRTALTHAQHSPTHPHTRVYTRTHTCSKMWSSATLSTCRVTVRLLSHSSLAPGASAVAMRSRQ